MKRRPKAESHTSKALTNLRRKIAEFKQETTTLRVLNQQLKHKSEDYALVNLINDAVNTGTSLTYILNLVTKTTKKLFSSDGATIYLLSKDKRHLILQKNPHLNRLTRKISGIFEEKIPLQLEITLGKGSLYKKILTTKRPKILNDAKSIQKLMSEFTESKLLRKLIPKIHKLLKKRSVMIAPLIFKNRAVGLMDISRDRPFKHPDIERFEAIARQITAIIVHYKIRKDKETAEEIFKTFMNSATEGFVLLDSELNIADVNNFILKKLGVTKKAVKGVNIADLAFDVWNSGRYNRLKEVMRTGRPYVIEDIIPSPRFGYRHLTLKAFRVNNGLGLIVSDITTQIKSERNLKESEERYRNLVEEADIAILLDDIDGNIVYSNKKLAEIFGYHIKDMTHMCISKLIHPDDLNRVIDYHKSRMSGKLAPKNYEFKGINKNGSTVFLEVHTVELKDSDQVKGTRSYIWDISARKLVEDQLRTLSLIDQLTGVYNRRGFLTVVRQYKYLAERAKRGFYILFIDIDGLKRINDNYGHHEGDLALQTLANICSRCFRRSDVVGRIGGDEFAICTIEAEKDTAKTLINRLQRCVEHHNKKKEHTFQLSLSIGAIYYGVDSPCSVEDLLDQADKSMYKQRAHKKANK
jgi:diguanylate cyclase (GGDEF)-like protein/PAS domain S-box-containing protein